MRFSQPWSQIREGADRGTDSTEERRAHRGHRVRKTSLPAMRLKKMVFSVSSFYLCVLCGIVTQFHRTASPVFLTRLLDIFPNLSAYNDDKL
jgi:hypothetical protein